jgi:predicted TPR repeat methyltransferase
MHAVCRAVFAFSTELLRQPAASADGRQQPGFRLQPTGRYSHTPEFLRRAAEETGWTRVLLLEEAEIRRNGGQPIHGSLCVLQRG